MIYQEQFTLLENRMHSLRDFFGKVFTHFCSTPFLKEIILYVSESSAKQNAYIKNRISWVTVDRYKTLGEQLNVF